MCMLWFIVLFGFNFIFLHFKLIVINIINIPKFKLGIRLKQNRVVVHGSLCLAFSLPFVSPHIILLHAKPYYFSVHWFTLGHNH